MFFYQSTCIYKKVVPLRAHRLFCHYVKRYDILEAYCIDYVPVYYKMLSYEDHVLPTLFQDRPEEAQETFSVSLNS